MLLAVLSCAWGQSVFAQRFPYQDPSPALEGNAGADRDGAEFHFARLMYNDISRRGWGSRCGSGTWTTDCPEAEHFFMEGLTRLTLVDGVEVNIYNGQGSNFVRLTDPEIFDYPFLYAVEVGFWTLSAEEIRNLRGYLLKGGFLMVDDFHGPQEWNDFAYVLQRVFPDRPIVDLEPDDEIFHVLYDFDDKVQIPGIASLQYGVTHEKGGIDPHWRGVYDDDGRLMVMINHNMDLGDAWEHADTPGYPQPMTAMAYRFAVNYVIYAMTH